MKQIPLTQGKFALVDDDLYLKISKYKWFANKKGNSYYAMRWNGKKDGKRLLVYLHFIVLGMPQKGYEIDHIDGDGLNNQRNNLKIGSHRKNMQNRVEHRKGNLVGVSFHKASGKWQARIAINGKRLYLGVFDTEQEASDAYSKILKF